MSIYCQFIVRTATTAVLFRTFLIQESKFSCILSFYSLDIRPAMALRWFHTFKWRSFATTDRTLLTGFNLGTFYHFFHWINWEILHIQNDRLLRALQDFKWYLLPKEKQKDVLHMMLRLQNGVSLTIGPFQQLDFVTLKTVSILFSLFWKKIIVIRFIFMWFWIPVNSKSIFVLYVFDQLWNLNCELQDIELAIQQQLKRIWFQPLRINGIHRWLTTLKTTITFRTVHSYCLIIIFFLINDYLLNINNIWQSIFLIFEKNAKFVAIFYEHRKL